MSAKSFLSHALVWNVKEPMYTWAEWRTFLVVTFVNVDVGASTHVILHKPINRFWYDQVVKNDHI